MSEFQGIGPDALFLLSQNRFEDSKAFYEAQKPAFKAQVFAPMAQLMADLSEDFLRLDPQMNLQPGRAVSRIRRDTRFTKDKRLYRDNVWIMFMRQKGDHPVLLPAMWFEFKPDEGIWSAGVCSYDSPPAYMQFLRGRILAQPAEFLTAVGSALQAGAALHSEPYKKDRAPDAPPELKPYLSAKNFFFMHSSADMQLLGSEALIPRLRGLYAAYAPMYRWLLAAMEDYLSQFQNESLALN